MMKTTTTRALLDCFKAANLPGNCTLERRAANGKKLHGKFSVVIDRDMLPFIRDAQTTGELLEAISACVSDADTGLGINVVLMRCSGGRKRRVYATSPLDRVRQRA